MSPSVAARPLFLAARAWPLSLRTFLAPSTSPLDSSSARFTSIIPAAVSSRSCLIFSIVLAKVLSSPQSLRSPRPGPPRRGARTLLLRAPQPQALRKLLVQRPLGRRPPLRRLQYPRPQVQRLPAGQPPPRWPPPRPPLTPPPAPLRPRTRPR